MTHGLTRRQVLALPLALAGCGGGGGADGQAAARPMSSTTPTAPDSRLSKDGLWLHDGKETAMVVFNGEALAITFARGWASFEGTKIEVRRFCSGELLAEHPWPGGMGCAIVKDGAIHIFGNTRWEQLGNKIIHSVLAADFTPSAPVDALLMNAPSNPFRFYNTSVTADANGYRMVVETTAGTYFARSPNLDTWEFYGGQLAAGLYIGCPSIHYLNGTHWLTWLASEGGGHVTKVARSTDDCFTFTYGKTLLAAAPDEGTNNSDVDMVEIGGRVLGVYLDGDQTTYANLRRWSYDGTLAQMFAEYA